MKAWRATLPWSVGFVLVAPVVFWGCSPTRPSMYRMAFLPPLQQPPEREALAAAPPVVQPSLYLHETPRFLEPGSLPAPSPAEALLRRAQTRFNNGRRLFRAGQMEAARREFDQAIDTLLTIPPEGTGRRDVEQKLAELTDAIHQYDLSGFGAGDTNEPAFQSSPLEEIPEPTFPIDPKLRGQVAEQLRATSSQLPLEMNDDVLRYVNYFSTPRGRKILLNGLVHAGRYRPMIQRIFDEEGIPQELIHLGQAESAFAPRALSRKAAAGMWQFVAWRGREYGLMRTKSADDRLDPEKATRAAARHLRDLYTEFGDWYLAMAAYNCGPVCVASAVERTGYADVWELRRRSVLPRETANYVPIILAMVIMAKNPAQYGLLNVQPDPPLEYSTVELDAPVHLQLIADITERPVSEIRALNPALLSPVAPVGYTLRVPMGAGGAVSSALGLIPAARRTAWRVYRIAEGDTLDGVARLYRLTRQQLAEANPAAGDICEPGSLLVVPTAPKPVRAAVRSTGPARREVRSRAATATKKSAGVAAKAASPAGSLVAAKRSGASRSSAVAR